MRLRCLLCSAILAVAMGHVPVAGSPARPPGHHLWTSFLATAYCRDGETQSGTRTRPGVAAADPHVLPTGSVVRVRGLGSRERTYSVEDHGVKGRHIDIFIRSCRAAKRFGRRLVFVHALTIGQDQRIRTDGRQGP